MKMLTAPYDTARAQAVVARLRLSENIFNNHLADALSMFFENSISAEEQVWVDRVESLRRDLGRSSKALTLVDYGGAEPVTVERTVSYICRSAATQPRWGTLLLALVRKIQPNLCLELGTSLGISTAFQGAALELNRSGRIITLEGAEALAAEARVNLGKVGVERFEVVCGRFEDTLKEVLSRTSKLPFAFIDGHHDEIATQHYYYQILPHLAEGAVIVFDDISWSPGMRRAWRSIMDDSNVLTALDLERVGICLIGKTNPKQDSQLRLAWQPKRWQKAIAKWM